MKNVKDKILSKSNRGAFESKKMILTLIFVAVALIIFGVGLFGIVKCPNGAHEIVNLAQVVIALVSGTMSATILHCSILDYRSITSLESISKSENKSENISEDIHESVDTVEKILRPKDVDNGSLPSVDPNYQDSDNENN